MSHESLKTRLEGIAERFPDPQARQEALLRLARECRLYGEPALGSQALREAFQLRLEVRRRRQGYQAPMRPWWADGP